MAEKLIELVQTERCLYDTSHVDYSKNSLKELLWARIAKELGYKDGPSAKDAWQKLRNCHRDAIRRKANLFKSVSPANVTKGWKFEQQMEFLMPHMTNRLTTANTSTGKSTQEASIQPEYINEYLEMETESEENETLSTVTEINFRSLSPTTSPRNTVNLRELSPELRVATSRASSSKKLALNKLIAKTLNNHEKRAKRAEKRAYSNEDDLQQFFNTIYSITKKMPALSQHKLKRQIFNMVSDEEEYLLHSNSTPIVLPIEHDSSNES